MFERFTDTARRCVIVAQEDAHNFHHNCIDSDHLLSGVAAAADGATGEILEGAGITHDAVLGQIRTLVGNGLTPDGGGHLPFSPKSKEILELALREALALGHNFIAPAHIMLALLRDETSQAASVLHVLVLDFDANVLRKALVEALARDSGEGEDGVTPPDPIDVLFAELEQLERVAESVVTRLGRVRGQLGELVEAARQEAGDDSDNEASNV